LLKIKENIAGDEWCLGMARAWLYRCHGKHPLLFPQEIYMKRVQKGFTLIELMIVVAIIGILAAIALPAYQDYTKRTHVAEGLTLAGGAKTSVTEFYSSNNRFPASNTSAGLASVASITGNAVSSITVGTSGVITVAYNSKVDSTASKFKVTLTPDASNGGSVVWKCAAAGTNGVDTKFLPSNCR